MVSKVKQWIQHKLNIICYNKYIHEVERQKDCYRQWYLHNERWRGRRLPPADEEIVLFADRDGIVDENAAGVMAAFFRDHPYVQIAYADEDCLDEKGRRYDPWFKPQWSPDTLDSFQYFGHCFAVRKALLSDMPRELWEEALTDCSGEAAYRLLLTLTRKVTEQKWIGANDKEKAIMPVEKVLIHMREEKRDMERADIGMPDIRRRDRQDAFHRADNAAVPVSVSVIIPSKDNPDVLRTCISSVREKTALTTQQGDAVSLEIIVVDNGSGDENKKQVEELARRHNFRYLYEPQPFNFSVMCNLAADRAKGEYLLFLNDDMEIIQPDWLIRLLEKGALPHVGAVGAKLLYPDSDLIQHAGITNIKAGPVHKLLKHHDEFSYYHGQNRHNYDMIGVTAACLLIKKEKFLEAGRFWEGLAVAYNDVDFCFRLHELGYYNVFLGGVKLYHHESLSRGDDNLSDEKWLRLLEEKDRLFARHPSLKSFDPFYSRNLAVHSGLYYPNFMYEFEKRDYYTQVKRWKGGDPAKWHNDCLIVNAEHAREEKKLELTERGNVYWIEGWSYVLGLDNCRYRRKLLLHGSKGGIYEAQILERYRKDVADILPQQTNVALAGFVCRIPKDSLPEDTYTVSMLAKDRCSNQRLYKRTEMSFSV